MDETKIGVLVKHGIKHRVWKGQLQAEDVTTRVRGPKRKICWGRKWRTITGWSIVHLMAWLGY